MNWPMRDWLTKTIMIKKETTVGGTIPESAVDPLTKVPKVTNIVTAARRNLMAHHNIVINTLAIVIANLVSIDIDLEVDPRCLG